MLRFTASALALLVAFSLMPVAPSEAGSRNERHRIVKHQKYRMIDRSASRFDRRHLRRVSARAVVVVKVDGGRRSYHRRHRYLRDNYYGAAVMDGWNGIGPWSYNAYSSDIVYVTVRPSAKIIDVGTLKPNSACEMQAGVCVIKP